MMMGRPIVHAAGLVALGAALAACAATPPAVERARSSVSAMHQDPLVTQHAPVAAARADEALARVDAAAQGAANEAELNHLAYLVDRRVQIAEEQAAASDAQARIDTLASDRDQILLDAERWQAARAEARADSALAAARAARDRNAALSAQLADLQGKQTERGLVLTLGDILFEVDGAALQPGGQEQVRRIAEAVKAGGNDRILVEGHTDNRGTEAYNRDLSQRRAAAVRDALVQDGVAPDLITVRGRGEDYPVATNDTAAGRQQNRRVELVIGAPTA